MLGYLSHRGCLEQRKRPTREYTNKITDLVEEGLIDQTYLINQLLTWLSEHEVEEFYKTNLADDFDVEDEE